jgi:hypothetical protein
MQIQNSLRFHLCEIFNSGTEGVFRVYRISIAIFLLTQQRNLNQYRKEVIQYFFLLFFSYQCRTMCHSIENASPVV